MTMREAYVNGRYLPHGKAQIHIEDRGYQFADGVYEVVPIVAGIAVDEAAHLDRLERSLGELSITPPCSRRVLQMITHEMIRRNRVDHGLVYMQITRGVASRNHAFPDPATPSSLVITTKLIDPTRRGQFEQGVSVVTTPDLRWGRCDIKTISLLPNCLAKEKAQKAGAFEAWQIDRDGFVTEGSSSNAWIITHDGTIVTREANEEILNGITRLSILQLAHEDGLEVCIRKFSAAEALAAREAFISSATSFVTPVVMLDGKAIGDGRPGSFCRRLLARYEASIKATDEEQKIGIQASMPFANQL